MEETVDFIKNLNSTYRERWESKENGKTEYTFAEIKLLYLEESAED